MSGTHINQLEPNCLTRILSLLPAADCARAASCQRLWREAGVDDLLWRDYLSNDYLSDAAVGPRGQVCNTFRQAYQFWRIEFQDLPLPLLKRALTAWRAIERWLRLNYEAISSTLRPGASQEDLQAVVQQLGRPLPLALQAIYRLHDGQDLKFDMPMQRRTPPHNDASLFHGLFGGVGFYEHLSCVRLLPVSRMLHWTKLLRSRKGILPDESLPLSAVVAASFNYTKLQLVDLDTGDLYVGLGDRLSVRPSAPPSEAAARAAGQGEAALRWFEEYARRLAAGYYQPALLRRDVPISKAICTFPLQPPELVARVTQGVQVCATSVYVPENSIVSPNRTQHFYSYSIRFSLLPPEEQLQHWPATSGPPRIIKSCQLLSRHWVMRNAAGQKTDEVQGEAVVGQYPLLRPGEPEFIYESCTHSWEPSSSMEGTFRFVEGSRAQPTGPEWDVICPRFTMQVPDFVY